MKGSWTRLVAAALGVGLASLGCSSPPDPSIPPPTGRSYEAYLEEGKPKSETIEVGLNSDKDAMVLHFIDVGQGAATLVEFPCGAILIDTGGEHNELFDSEPVLMSYLNQFFERRKDLDRTLDSLVITHPHIDHTRSIDTVLRNFHVRNIVDNGDVKDDIGGKPQLAMHSWIYDENQRIARHNKSEKRRRNRRGGQKHYLQPVGHLDISSEDVNDRGLSNEVIDPIPACPASSIDPEIRALWGIRLGRTEKGHNPNNDSVVLRVEYGENSALLSGDLELLAIAWMSKHYKDNLDILDTDIYYVPHHGSRNSTGENWVAGITPRVAVISMGPYGRHLDTWPEYTARSFGHPNINSIEHLIAEQGGVTAVRAEPIDVKIGRRGRWKETPSEFETRRIEKAVYATGWDGHVQVIAYPDGRIEVETSGRGGDQDEAVARKAGPPAPDVYAHSHGAHSHGAGHAHGHNP